MERWRHLIYETWKFDKVEIAILGELLLRGAQTEGELRARASRMELVGEMDAMRLVLRRLSERRLVVYLTPEGRRGTTLTHGFHAPEDLERLRAKHGSDADEVEEFVSRSDHSDEADRGHRQAYTGRLEEALTQITSLQSVVEELKSKMACLEEDVRTIKQGLGI